jgi:hypothetical protein
VHRDRDFAELAAVVPFDQIEIGER